jgi:hypothetical protein
MFHAETGGRNGVAGTRDREDWLSEDVPGPQRGLPEAAPPGGAPGTRGPLPSPPRSFPRRPTAPRRTADRPIALLHPRPRQLRRACRHSPGPTPGNNPFRRCRWPATPLRHIIPLVSVHSGPPGLKRLQRAPARVDERGKVPSAVALNLGPPGMLGRIVRHPSDARMGQSMRLGPIQQPQTPI